MKGLGLFVLCLLAPAYTRHSLRPNTALTSAAEYDLTIHVTPDAHRLEITGLWRLAPSRVDRNQVEFYLSPKMEGLEVQLLEPKASGPLILQSHQEEGGDTKWIFRLTRPIPAGASTLLQFSYASDGKPAPQLNVSPAGSFAGGGGELWYPQTSYKDRQTGILRFFAPAGEKVISNGTLQSTEQQKAKGEFVYSVTQPSKFAFASGKYTVTRRAGKVPFNLYLLRPRTQAQSILDGSARALNFLTHVYGAFPYGEFSLVEVNFPTVVSGTSEFGFIFADDSKLEQFDLAYWAHEMGHQWWGNTVRSASGTPGQMMLSEGVTQFGALQAVEAVEGSVAAEQFRRNGYHGKGQSAAAYFRLVQSGKDLPLTSYIPGNQNETLTMHALANTKGFFLLDMLSRRIGRDKFAAILRNFVSQKSNLATSWQDFQHAIEVNSAQDIHWFFEQWFARPGAPDYKLSWQQKGRIVRASVSQPAPYFRATVEVELIGLRRRETKTIEVSSGQTEFSWRVPFKVASVVLDPHYRVLRWLPEFRSQPAK